MSLKTATETTGTNLQSMPMIESHDFFVRFSKDMTSTWGMRVASVDTDGLFYWMQSKNQEMQTLKRVVHWQHKLLDYNSHYCAFLLGQVNEDEFEDIAESFSYETRDLNPVLLTPMIEQVYKLTEIEYTPSDFAGFFECRTENVVDALKPLALANKKLNEMLPTSIQE